jgi:DNA helicase-2/ATP-dependent DNA helicase PcrA
MAETRLDIMQSKDEFQQIMEHIANGDNFLLSGGAGSGKTYSLVQVIRKVIEDNPTSKVACMTYTNAAVKEIEERVNHKNLNVSTIHDFLWDNIKHFQKELKCAIIELANNETITKIKIDDVDVVPTDYFENREEPVKIQYKEYLKLKEGIISHDELLVIANYIFEKYSKLNDIVKDKYKFIFIDEYQDTHTEVVKILLEHFTKSNKKSIIGFFGDAMQSIYDDGIGNINDYKGNEDGKVKEVKKIQNRRNPQNVITLANRLRTDGITQEPSKDNSAPNMKKDGSGVKDGKILFLYSANEDISKVEQYLSDNYTWDFSNSKETKELNLTHNLIADKAGFRTLMDIYDKDPILALKNEISKKVKENNIIINDDATFDQVVDQVALKNRQKQLKKDLILQDTTNSALYNQLKDKLYSEVKKLYVDKDQLIDDKKQDEDDENKKGSQRDNLIKHLYKIQTNIALYTNKQYNEFLRITDYKRIRNIEDKRTLQQNIESLINIGDKTIEDVINDAHEKCICLKDDKLEKFIDEKEYIYNRVKDVKYSEFQKLYDYLEGKTPFSTQHKTKGTEFNNVLVILDNGRWNDYNFDYLMNDRISNTLDANKKKSYPRILERTQKIFYVCCTRAKENLAVFYYDPNQNVIDKAQEWFGKENVINLDS